MPQQEGQLIGAWWPTIEPRIQLLDMLCGNQDFEPEPIESDNDDKPEDDTFTDLAG
jgi:hypothetical protein